MPWHILLDHTYQKDKRKVPYVGKKSKAMVVSINLYLHYSCLAFVYLVLLSLCVLYFLDRRDYFICIGT